MVIKLSCHAKTMTPGDGVDNDCDGEVDEEDCDGKGSRLLL